MSDRIENIMKNRASIESGWKQTILNDDKIIRSIRIGSQTNCNGDELICDETTYDKMKDILEKYNITKFVIQNIRNNFEYSTEIQLDESEYEEFIEKLS